METQTFYMECSIRWLQAKNIWHNAGVRAMMYVMAAPVCVSMRWVRKSRKRAVSQ